MKRLFLIFLLFISNVFVFISCKDDDSAAITQPELLSAHDWKLKEERRIKENITSVHKISACEKQSTLSFAIKTNQYNFHTYTTNNENCTEKIEQGSYEYSLSGIDRRKIILKSSDQVEKKYYVNQLDLNFLVLQDTISKETETEVQELRLKVYEPK